MELFLKVVNGFFWIAVSDISFITITEKSYLNYQFPKKKQRKIQGPVENSFLNLKIVDLLLTHFDSNGQRHRHRCFSANFAKFLRTSS